MARADDPVTEAAGALLNSFKHPARLLVAISGGSDSTGLLLALAAMVGSGRYPGISLAACTVDHALREGSGAEAQAVASLCRRHGIHHLIRRWDGEKPRSGLQAAAREKRYDLLLEAAAEVGADAILTGHTLDDQRETIAMRGERAGEGVGLSGMAQAVMLRGRVWMLRPFLGLRRADIRAFLMDIGEDWSDDPSNANRAFERVRIRDELGERSASPGGATAAERLALSTGAASFLAMHVRAPCAGVASLGVDGVLAVLREASAWRGLAVLAAVMGGRDYPPERVSMERIRAFLERGDLSRLTAGRVVFDRRRDGLYLYRECRGMTSVSILPGDGVLWDGRFSIVNRSARTVLVEAAGARGIPPDEEKVARPRGVAGRARSAMPAVVDEDGASVPAQDVTMCPILAPYARFLPRFDLPLANALADLMGLARFPYPPNE